MRTKVKDWDAKHNDLRIRSGFAFVPKTIKRETRWLERVTWIERCISTEQSDNVYWVDHEWVDNPIEAEKIP